MTTEDASGETSAWTATRPLLRWSSAQGPLRRPVFWVTLVNLLVIALFGTISTNHVFISAQNTRGVLLSASLIITLSVGQAMLLAAGQLDISVGANVVLSSVVGAQIMVASSGTYEQVTNGEFPRLAPGVTLGILASLGTGLIFGLINGLLVGWLGVNALVTTLGTLGIGTGLAYILTDGLNVAYIPPVIQTGFGSKVFFGLMPAPTVVVAVICVIMWIAMTKCRFGMRTLAIGSSREAAERCGLPVRTQTVKLFAVMGLLAGFCGILDIARFSTTNVSGHTTDALAAIAGAVIGGTSLFGGEISIVGAVMGALLTVLLQVGLVIINVQSFYQMIAVGVVLIAAVAVDERRRGRRSTSG